MPEEQPVDLKSLKQEYQMLLKLVQALVIILIVLSASLNVFLLREVTLVQVNLKQREQGIVQYNENGRERLEDFIARMHLFAEENSDFVPVLDKHFPPIESETAADSDLQPETNISE